MKRRDFLTTGVAAGLVGTLTTDPKLADAQVDSEKEHAPLTDNRPAEYLHHVQADRFLPKQPAPARSYPIAPMPLAQRVSRKIVPQRGFCSIAPGELVSEALITGNGSMTLELMGDPYAEQILFHHESLLMPWKKPGISLFDLASISPGNGWDYSSHLAPKQPGAKVWHPAAILCQSKISSVRQPSGPNVCRTHSTSGSVSIPASDRLSHAQR